MTDNTETNDEGVAGAETNEFRVNNKTNPELSGWLFREPLLHLLEQTMWE